jgi:hypothetical protein
METHEKPEWFMEWLLAKSPSTAIVNALQGIFDSGAARAEQSQHRYSWLITVEKLYPNGWNFLGACYRVGIALKNEYNEEKVEIPFYLEENVQGHITSLFLSMQMVFELQNTPIDRIFPVLKEPS